MPIRIVIFFVCSFISSRGAHGFECKVCHSKNPAMVRMHQATQQKGAGCFDCHKIGERLMGKGEPKDRNSLLKRRVTEAVCTGCHKS